MPASIVCGMLLMSQKYAKNLTCTVIFPIFLPAITTTPCHITTTAWHHVAIALNQREGPALGGIPLFAAIVSIAWGVARLFRVTVLPPFPYSFVAPHPTPTAEPDIR